VVFRADAAFAEPEIYEALRVLVVTIQRSSGIDFPALPGDSSRCRARLRRELAYRLNGVLILIFEINLKTLATSIGREREILLYVDQ
jgi:hypothetical protein